MLGAIAEATLKKLDPKLRKVTQEFREKYGNLS